MTGDTIVSLLGIFLIIGVTAYIFLPYFLGINNLQKEELEKDDIKGSLLSSLADLVYDYKSGKISEEDFKRLRLEIETKLYAIEHTETQEQKDKGNANPSDTESDEEN